MKHEFHKRVLTTLGQAGSWGHCKEQNKFSVADMVKHSAMRKGKGEACSRHQLSLEGQGHQRSLPGGGGEAQW